jgi:hypothetical protein
MLVTRILSCVPHEPGPPETNFVYVPREPSSAGQFARHQPGRTLLPGTGGAKCWPTGAMAPPSYVPTFHQVIYNHHCLKHTSMKLSRINEHAAAEWKSGLCYKSPAHPHRHGKQRSSTWHTAKSCLNTYYSTCLASNAFIIYVKINYEAILAGVY